MVRQVQGRSQVRDTQDWTHRRWSPWCSQSLTSSNTQGHQQKHPQLLYRIQPSSTRTNSCTSGHESQRHRRQDTQDLATRSVQRTHWTIQQSHHTRHKKSFPRETTPRCRENHRQDVAWTQQEQMLHSSDTWRTPTTPTLHSHRQYQQPHQRQEARDHPHYRLRIQDPGREEQGGLGPTHTSYGDGRVGSHQMGMDPRSHRWRDGHQQLHPTVRTTHSPTRRQDPTSQRSLEHLFLATRYADEIRRHIQRSQHWYPTRHHSTHWHPFPTRFQESQKRETSQGQRQRQIQVRQTAISPNPLSTSIQHTAIPTAFAIPTIEPVLAWQQHTQQPQWQPNTPPPPNWGANARPVQTPPPTAPPKGQNPKGKGGKKGKSAPQWQ